MNILIITAHPSPLAETHLIAKTYAEANLEKNNRVQLVDLYADEYKVDLLKFIDIHNFKPSKVQLKFQEQIKWANEIVVVHPIWWGTTPAIMKNWVDLTFWSKVSYHYEETGKLKKLFVGKTAKIFATCEGPSWYHYFIFMPLTSFWKISVFGFSGVDVVDVKICGNLSTYKEEKRKKHLAKFLQKIKYN
jgi:putative NADPH-quinone reductase